MNNEEEKIRINSDKYLRILKGSFFIILPFGICIYFFKNAILQFISGFGIELDNEMFGFIVVIICLVVLKWCSIEKTAK